MMSKAGVKPLNWTPPDDPRIGYTVARREDGGLQVTFTNASHETLMHWRQFALSHLEHAEGMNRNLYDLRAVDSVPEEAIRLAIEANSDPAARQVRLAILIAEPALAARLQEIAALSMGAEMRLFTDQARPKPGWPGPSAPTCAAGPTARPAPPRKAKTTTGIVDACGRFDSEPAAIKERRRPPGRGRPRPRSKPTAARPRRSPCRPGSTCR
jgi:hypothetical protein